MNGLRAAIGLCLASAACVTIAQSTRRYHHAELGYSMDYPSFLRPIPGTQGPEGTMFANLDSSIVLTVWSTRNFNRATSSSAARELTANLRKLSITPTYRVVRRTWFVLSWYDGSSIVYEKRFVHPSAETGFRIRYPIADKEFMDPYITKLSRSLRP